MCGRFTLTPEQAEIVAARLGIEPSEVMQGRYRPHWNIAPMQEHWIARLEREERRIDPAVWGLVSAGKSKPINVRSESLVQGSFRRAFAETRCVVPADGFFEWLGDEHARRPFWFHRPDRDLFVFAGLYTEAPSPRGESVPLRTFTIITTTPNGLVAPFHDRMPVILPDDEAVEEWLYPQQTPERLHALLRPVPDDFLEAMAVSTRVNSVRNDDPDCLAEAEPETQASLL